MCGIAGILSPHSSLVQQHKLQAMIDALQHRGPDGEGSWTNEKGTVAFGHRRLSIIDGSPQGAQPFHYLHYSLVFNGAIYNYTELKAELETAGYSFVTSSDTEVIPAAYDHWGKDCLHHFDGMFAFALYDVNEQNIFIARDRFGEKPFYYHAVYANSGVFETFLFASEMKALWAADIEKSLDGTMLLNYITLGYVQNPIKKTGTFYSNILSLPPGHCLSIQPTAGKIQMRKWYQPGLSTVMISENAAIEKFKDLFLRSVKRRMRAQVPIGSSLSGGLDSSSVMAAIHQLQNSSAQWSNKVFTAIFPGFEKDEADWSRGVANHFNANQHTISPTADDWVNNWQRLMYHQEEPLQSSSVLTQFGVFGLAKEKNIRVLLDGQGADEILGGYKKYAHWYLQELFRTQRAIFNKEKKLLKQNDFSQHWGWKNYAAAIFPAKAALQLQQDAIHDQNHHEYIDPVFLEQYRNRDTLLKPVVKQLDDILYYNTFQMGLEELLRYADRNSMAHSVEVRLPFLDHELVEFIFSLPSSFKIKDGFTKWILRMSMRELLPAAIVWRKGKTGYEPPQEQWMKHKQVQEMIREGRKKLVQKNILDPAVMNEPVKPQQAHAAANFDWRYLCAASIF